MGRLRGLAPWEAQALLELPGAPARCGAGISWARWRAAACLFQGSWGSAAVGTQGSAWMCP